MESGVARLRRVTNLLIYASALLGVGLLVQLYGLVPGWLFFSVAAGWAIYVANGVAARRGIAMAYPVSLILAVLTLAVSIPQPEHAALLMTGPGLASVTLVAGSALQVMIIVTASLYLVLDRQNRRRISGSK